MIKLTYNVSLEEKDLEIKWLRDQKIYASWYEGFDWVSNKRSCVFGMIVTPEAASMIKLRHQITQQEEYIRK